MGAGAEAILAAHAHSFRHRSEVNASEVCGCFHCLDLFAPAQIAEWRDGDETATCPRCGIDSVIGDKSGFPVSDIAFLTAMKTRWFDSQQPIKG